MEQTPQTGRNTSGFDIAFNHFLAMWSFLAIEIELVLWNFGHKLQKEEILLNNLHSPLLRRSDEFDRIKSDLQAHGSQWSGLCAILVANSIEIDPICSNCHYLHSPY